MSHHIQVSWSLCLPGWLSEATCISYCFFLVSRLWCFLFVKKPLPFTPNLHLSQFLTTSKKCINTVINIFSSKSSIITVKVCIKTMRKAHVGVEMQYWFKNTIKSAYHDLSPLRIAIRQSRKTVTHVMLFMVCYFPQHSLKKAKEIINTLYQTKCILIVFT